MAAGVVQLLLWILMVVAVVRVLSMLLLRPGLGGIVPSSGRAHVSLSSTSLSLFGVVDTSIYISAPKQGV